MTMPRTPTQIVDEAASWCAGAVELATVLSIASRSEPALVRAARLELVPSLNVSTEADLWFSPLVAVSDGEGLLFHGDLAQILRQRLARNRKLLTAARDLVVNMHRGTAPLVQMEDEILWLSAIGGRQEAERIDSLLRRVAATVRSQPERTDDLLRWMAYALYRLPQDALSGQWAGVITNPQRSPQRPRARRRAA